MKLEDFKGPREIPSTKENIAMVEKLCFRQNQDLLDGMIEHGVDKGEAVRYINKKYSRPVK